MDRENDFEPTAQERAESDFDETEYWYCHWSKTGQRFLYKNYATGEVSTSHPGEEYVTASNSSVEPSSPAPQQQQLPTPALTVDHLDSDTQVATMSDKKGKGREQPRYSTPTASSEAKRTPQCSVKIEKKTELGKAICARYMRWWKGNSAVSVI